MLRISCLSILLLILGPVGILGCTSTSRRPVPHHLIDDVAPEGMEYWRFVRDDVGLPAAQLQQRVDRFRAQATRSGLVDQPLHVLAISGGGANGAYGAGLLKGWSESGTRPEFIVVTGISTGALIAPFAFLGSDYDGALERSYTTVRTSDLVVERGFVEGILSDAVSEPIGLRRLLSEQIDEDAYRRIGEEHLRGRRLFIGTTNLDRMEPTYWCVSAIPAYDLPNGRELLLDILIASASIPGVFPPVMIDVMDEEGRVYDEMHVDGGVSAQVFTFPTTIRMRNDAEFGRVFGSDLPPTVWIIRNARLTLRFDPVERSLFSIAGRAVSGLIRSNGIGDLYRIWLTTRRDSMRFRLASIPFDFDAESLEPFDPVYMTELFELGRRDIRSGTAWSTHPPGIDSDDEAALLESLQSVEN